MSPLSVDREDDAHYCADCGWRTNVDEEYSRTDCTRRAIQHHVETAHTVVHQAADQRPDYSRPWLIDGRL